MPASPIPAPPTLEQLRSISLAYGCYRRQRDAEDQQARPGHGMGSLSGDDAGPASFDLTAIWRAAQADPTNRERPTFLRYMSPRRFVNEWSHLVTSVDGDDRKRIMADGGAAFAYVQQIDKRVMMAAMDLMFAAQKEAARTDPIGNAVRVAAGGPFAMLFARHDASWLGMSDEAFDEAVLIRAKMEVGRLDEYAAETLLSRVRWALEGGPRMGAIVSMINIKKGGA